MKKIKNWKIGSIAFLSLLAVTLCVVLICCQLKIKRDRIKEQETEIENLTIHDGFTLNEEQQESLQQALKYALGENSSMEYQKALDIFQIEILREIPDISMIIGEMYFQGLGTPKSEQLASQYVQEAYQRGCEEAIPLYGKMSFSGYGVIRQDYEEAAKAFYAVESKDAEVSCALGVMYLYGMGVPANFAKAMEYFEQAVSLGSKEAIEWKAKTEAVTVEEKQSEYQIFCRDSVLDKTDYGNDELERDIHILISQFAASEEDSFFTDKMASFMNMDVEKITKHIVFGKDNWLFWQNPEDGTAYHDFICDISFTEEELAAIAGKMEEIRKCLEEKGSRFVLMLLPNKENVYFEQMPSYIGKVGKTSRLTQLTEYLEQHTDIAVINLTDTYLEEKENHLLYYTTDTHFNMKGSFVAVAEFLEQECGKTLSIADTVFYDPISDYAGDVAMFMGMEEQYAQDTVFFQLGEDVPADDTVEASVTVIGDSFSEFFSQQCSYYFTGGVNHIRIMEHDYDYYDSTKTVLQGEGTDFVVWECVERYLDRLK